MELFGCRRQAGHDGPGWTVATDSELLETVDGDLMEITSIIIWFVIEEL